jgi:hypothetical protein
VLDSSDDVNWEYPIDMMAANGITGTRIMHVSTIRLRPLYLCSCSAFIFPLFLFTG